MPCVIRAVVVLLLFTLTPAMSQRAAEPSLPPSLSLALRQSRSTRDYAFEPLGVALGWSASNAAQGLRATFEGERTSVHALSGDPLVTLQLVAFGRDGAVAEVAPAVTSVAGARLERDRGVLVEWYLNVSEGLEQGFTVGSRPPGAAGALELRLTLGGRLQPRLSGDRATVVFSDEGGECLWFGQLAAWDAQGRVLASWIDIDGGALSLYVDDTDAAYPITVDPLLGTQQAKLKKPGAQTSAELGWAVAIANDTALVGEPRYDSDASIDVGAALVFVRSGGSWIHQATLTAADGEPGDQLGSSVALSDDGETAILGAPNEDEAGSFAGAAYVFVRSGMSWAQQGKLATPLSLLGFAGVSVGVEADTAVVGAPGAVNALRVPSGAAYVFVRSGTAWSLQAELATPDASAAARYGASVAIAGDTILVGAPEDSGDGVSLAGSAHVFTRIGTLWSLQQELLPTPAADTAFFGQAVALHADTALIGAPYDDSPGANNAGSAFVFVRSSERWTQQQQLVAEPVTAADYFGCAVTVDGDRAAIGALDDDGQQGQSTDAGAVYVFERSGSAWAQVTKQMPAQSGEHAGCAVALAGDTLVAGVMHDHLEGTWAAGSARVLVASGSSWTEEAVLAQPGLLSSESFGHAVALSGDTLAISTPASDSDDPQDGGSVFVLVRNGSSWEVQAELSPPTSTEAYFGSSLDLEGDTLLVGCSAEASTGAAYVFVRSGSSWTQQAKLLPVPADPAEGFGWAVALSGDTALVSAPFDESVGATNGGSVSVFVRTGTAWTLQQRLTAAPPNAFDFFGSAVGVSGDTAVIGASGDNTTGFHAGAMHVFVRSGATWTQQFESHPESVGASVGHAVAVEGDTAIALSSTKAHVYVRDGTAWSPQQVLQAPQATSLEHGLSLEGDRAVIGARLDGLGSACLFERDGSTWSVQATLKGGDVVKGDGFGAAVALAGDTVVVSSPTDANLGGPDAGAAYVFKLEGSEGAWIDLGFGLGSTDFGVPRFVGQGTLLPGSSGSLVLAGAKPAAVGSLFVSLTAAPTPFKGGLLVPVPPLLALLIVTSPAGGVTLPWSAWPAGIPSGSSFHVQFAVADPSAPAGVALSNAVKATTP